MALSTPLQHVLRSRIVVRLLVTLAASACLGMLLLPIWQSEPLVLFLRLAVASLAALCGPAASSSWQRPACSLLLG